MASPDRLLDWKQCKPLPSLSSAFSSSSINCDHDNAGRDDDVSKDTKDPPAVFTDKGDCLFTHYHRISQFPTVVSFFASNLVYLVTLLGLRTLHQNHYSGSNRTKRKTHSRRRLTDDVLYGLVSAIVSVLVTTPLWVARSRLSGKQSKSHKDERSNSKSTKQILGEVNMLRELMNITEDKGVGGLWEGLHSSLLVASINSPVQTVVYEALRRSFARRCGACSDNDSHPNANLCHLATLISMMVISRCTAITVTYPLSRAQRSKEEVKAGSEGDGNSNENDDVSKSSSSLLSTLQGIISTEGTGGLFKGVQMKLLQTSLLTGLLAFTHPRIVMYILKLYRLRTQKIS